MFYHGLMQYVPLADFPAKFATVIATGRLLKPEVCKGGYSQNTPLWNFFFWKYPPPIAAKIF